MTRKQAQYHLDKLFHSDNFHDRLHSYDRLTNLLSTLLPEDKTTNKKNIDMKKITLLIAALFSIALISCDNNIPLEDEILKESLLPADSIQHIEPQPPSNPNTDFNVADWHHH